MCIRDRFRVRLTRPAEIAIEPSTGWASGLTVMMKLLVALRFGVPLSVTCTLTRLVVLAWLTGGRQVKMPLVPLAVVSVALVGAVNKLKVSVCGGASMSIATLVMDRVIPALMVWLATGNNTGVELLAACPTKVTMLMAGNVQVKDELVTLIEDWAASESAADVIQGVTVPALKFVKPNVRII